MMASKGRLSLLEEPVLRAEVTGSRQSLCLPGVLAALARDEIESFPALRRHQAPAWHMFLVQIAAMALHRAGRVDLPETPEPWAAALRGLTPEFPDDEPWRLVVEDGAKPAFLQAPIPEGVALSKEVATPDGLDMLITARNHDIKQEIGRKVQADDWVFALVSGQTGDGYGGGGGRYHGIARMNGGSSSRVLFGFAPMPAADARSLAPRWGLRFRRDVRRLLASRAEQLSRFPLGYPSTGGLALVWTAPWPEGAQIPLSELDIWFVEICRRVRLWHRGNQLAAAQGTSSGPRIDAKANAGVVGDPWAPINRAKEVTLTLGDGDFDYRRLTELLTDGDWELPMLARLDEDDAREAVNWALVAQAFARGKDGKTRTDGFREQIIPIDGRVARGIGPRRAELHELSHSQISEIKKLNSLLEAAIGVFVRRGVYWQDVPKRNKKTELKRQAKISLPFRDALEIEADRRFFEALWARFDAQIQNDAEAAASARRSFVVALIKAARALLVEALADLPCASIARPRARARARAAFEAGLRSGAKGFPEYFEDQREEARHDA